MLNFKEWIVRENKQKPLAIIIKGNPNRKQPKTPGNLYPKLKKYLQDQGFQVEFDEGKPHTTPNINAQLWIGHSRGAGRLKFAPKHIITISIGSSLPHSINHPDDKTNIKPDEYDKLPNHIIKAHNSWHNSFKEKLDRKIAR
jgi:hypothetical protein